LNHGQVVETAAHLTDRIGGRRAWPRAGPRSASALGA
jgi:hypothetical protein